MSVSSCHPKELTNRRENGFLGDWFQAWNGEVTAAVILQPSLHQLLVRPILLYLTGPASVLQCDVAVSHLCAPFCYSAVIITTDSFFLC